MGTQWSIPIFAIWCGGVELWGSPAVGGTLSSASGGGGGVGGLTALMALMV
eukprot:TRINITY_DN12857_c0_g1_i1.p5 TRINITY_DN12857_c0_g1~~TRINITY_DN12857_c0_g1_i1.p5  ORF type:complete len:51 (+),score=11.56 TRINITY_DN12857_c0_g1_i1:247-399(+)